MLGGWILLVQSCVALRGAVGFVAWLDAVEVASHSCLLALQQRFVTADLVGFNLGLNLKP